MDTIVSNNPDINEIMEYVKNINSNVQTISKYQANGNLIYLIYKLKKALVLYTDIDHNILFEKTIEKCLFNKNVKDRIGQNSAVIKDYITFLERLERKTTIKKLNSEIWNS